MSESLINLQRKINSASDLQSVVRTMKAMAAASIGQYENAVRSLDDYYLTVQLGLTAYFQSVQREGVSKRTAFLAASNMDKSSPGKNKSNIYAIVFGSDQGLVGQFNELLVSFLDDELAKYPGKKICWPVGERMQARLNESKVVSGPSFALPKSIASITQLISELLIKIDAQWEFGNIKQVYLFFNHPTSKASYQPAYQRLLPMDRQWKNEFINKPWPNSCLPQVLVGDNASLGALIHEYLFVSIYRACAESLASENASRLVAMQRAEKNIEELQEQLHRSFHNQRQGGIDEELFDLVGGFEALNRTY